MLDIHDAACVGAARSCYHDGDRGATRKGPRRGDFARADKTRRRRKARVGWRKTTVGVLMGTARQRASARRGPQTGES
jgi:hypothetical protein